MATWDGELVVEAWPAVAPKRLAKEHFGA